MLRHSKLLGDQIFLLIVNGDRIRQNGDFALCGRCGKEIAGSTEHLDLIARLCPHEE
jgi:RNA polymerase-binding transcription factor DksA